jgi:hypothetical protein
MTTLIIKVRRVGENFWVSHYPEVGALGGDRWQTIHVVKEALSGKRWPQTIEFEVIEILTINQLLLK